MPASSRLKILFLIPHLGGGGAEHVIETLGRNVDPKKYDVHLGIVTRQRETRSHKPTAEFPSQVAIHYLGAKRVRTSATAVLRLAWRVRPAIIFGGMAHLNAFLLLLRPFLPPGTRFIIRQNGSVHAMLGATPLPLARLFFKIAYRRAHRIICQTDAMAQELQQVLDLPSARLCVLPNPVDLEGIRRCARICTQRWRGAGPNLLAIGRLSHEKGFDLLLDAFARLHGHFPAAELVIAGAGRCEAALKRQSAALGISNYVHFVGHVPSPVVYFPATTAFVLSSLDEGLPNALLEAAAGGLPIIALPSNQGIVELLNESEGVWIARDLSSQSLHDRLVDALSALAPGQRFSHPWIERFDLLPAITAFESIVDLEVATAKQ